MKFLWTTLTVSNMEKSLQFYQVILGLSLKNRMTSPGMQLAFLGDGETQVELIEQAKKSPAGLQAPISMGFQVPDLDATMAMVKAKGVAIESGPFQPNPGIRFFYVRDPDGMHIQFVQRFP